MSPRVYPFIRDLHLYVGLFLSPFVVVFAISVIFLVHSWVPGSGASAVVRNETNLSIPPDFERLKGREQIDAAHAVLNRIGVRGEIGFIRQFPKERRFVIPVFVPGHEAVVDLSVESRSAKIASRPTGIADATVFLHKMPGPHNVGIRGNTGFMRAWRGLADATVYLLLFVSASGIYLWTALKTERRVGMVLLVAGGLSLSGLLYALVG